MTEYTASSLIAEVEVAVKETLLDMPEIEAGEDEIFSDLLVAVALTGDAPADVVAEACRRSLGFVPYDLCQMRPEVEAAFVAAGGGEW